jgi:hypothetical protein
MQVAELSGDFVFTVSVPPTAAATAIEVPIVRPPWAATITSIVWIPGAAITANASNFFTLTPRNRGAGAGAVIPATARSYAATNSVSTTPEALVLSTTATDLLVAAADVLTAHFTHSGTGLAIPAGLVQVTMRLR